MEQTVVVNLKIDALKTDVYVDSCVWNSSSGVTRNKSVTIIETGQLVMIICVYCSK
jgi:hypothetical protein